MENLSRAKALLGATHAITNTNASIDVLIMAPPS